MNNLFDNWKMLIPIYVIFINLLTFGLFSLDKRRARLKSWRVSEASLIFLSLMGGALGAMVAMNLFRHKTRKVGFRLGLPILFVFNLLSLIFLMKI